MERLNAPIVPNKQLQTLKESSSNKEQSVLGPTIPQPVMSLPASTSEPICTTAVNAEMPVKLVSKTPVQSNFPSASQAPRTQNKLTVSNSDSSTTYSSCANDLFPFPFVEQIATDIIESIIKNAHYKSSFESLIRKNILFKYKPHIIKKF